MNAPESEVEQLRRENIRLRGELEAVHDLWLSADNGEATWKSRPDLDVKWRARTWIAGCGCGWQGPLRKSKEQATQDHVSHLSRIIGGPNG